VTSREVNEAVGTAPDYDELTRRATQLRAVVAQPSDKERAAQELATIEQQLATRREDEGRAAAQARLTGIRRGVGSLLNEYGENRRAVEAAIAAVRQSIVKLNARAAAITGLHDEAAALADRFGLPLPALARLLEPEAEIDRTLPAFWQHRQIPHVAIEQDEHHLRERRTYQEVDGSEGYRIIEAAGLKPWPELTEEQRALLAERAADRKQAARDLAKFAEEAVRLRAEGALLRGNVRLGKVSPAAA